MWFSSIDTNVQTATNIVPNVYNSLENSFLSLAWHWSGRSLPKGNQWECWDPGLGPNVVRLPVHLPPPMPPDTPTPPATLNSPTPLLASNAPDDPLSPYTPTNPLMSPATAPDAPHTHCWPQCPYTSATPIPSKPLHCMILLSPYTPASPLGPFTPCLHPTPLHPCHPMPPDTSTGHAGPNALWVPTPLTSPWCPYSPCWPYHPTPCWPHTPLHPCPSQCPPKTLHPMISLSPIAPELPTPPAGLLIPPIPE